jgi:Ca2+-binding EF-hand superfamily protein
MAYQQPYHPGTIDPQVAQWFAAVDTDRSGRITAPELQGALMSSNGQKFSEAACRLMIGMFDNGTGSIDINGFTHLFQYVNQWLTAFRTYDADQSGFINSQELSSALQTMGYRFSQPFIDMLAGRFGDKGGKGLPVDGFIMSCILIQKFTEGFRQKDLQQQGVISIAYEDFLSMILTAWT